MTIQRGLFSSDQKFSSFGSRFAKDILTFQCISHALDTAHPEGLSHSRVATIYPPAAICENVAITSSLLANLHRDKQNCQHLCQFLTIQQFFQNTFM